MEFGLLLISDTPSHFSSIMIETDPKHPTHSVILLWRLYQIDWPETRAQELSLQPNELVNDLTHHV